MYRTVLYDYYTNLFLHLYPYLYRYWTDTDTDTDTITVLNCIVLYCTVRYCAVLYTIVCNTGAVPRRWHPPLHDPRLPWGHRSRAKGTEFIPRGPKRVDFSAPAKKHVLDSVQSKSSLESDSSRCADEIGRILSFRRQC